MKKNDRTYFGTDGIRGKVNSPPLTPQFVQGLGIAAVTWFKNTRGKMPKVGIGFDTRNSGPMLAYALASGTAAAGSNTEILGIIPTPGVAHWTKNSDLHNLGVIISASHNPFFDNGIKLFTPEGFKLSDTEETQIEKNLKQWLQQKLPLAPPEKIGNISENHTAKEEYLQYLFNLWPKKINPKNLKIVLDTANGAAYEIAPQLFKKIGVELLTFNHNPDGKNINRDCGALYPETLAEKVKELNADIGFALDGDSDRLIAIDERGNIIDGDKILFICATYMQRRGELKNSAVAATVMSNLGLELSLQKFNIKMFRTPVGDRYVSSAMRERELSLGGEESGHIIFSKYSTTGDGLLTALQLLKIAAEEKKPLSQLLDQFISFPQVKLSLPVREKKPWEEIPSISKIVSEIKELLSKKGKRRLLLRYSGTENKIRIMLEGPDKSELKIFAKKIADAFQKELGI